MFTFIGAAIYAVVAFILNFLAIGAYLVLALAVGIPVLILGAIISLFQGKDE